MLKVGKINKASVKELESLVAQIENLGEESTMIFNAALIQIAQRWETKR